MKRMVEGEVGREMSQALGTCPVSVIGKSRRMSPFLILMT